MSYIVIDDFKLGMDRRKERIAGTPGALWDGINGHINRGGSFERRKKLVLKYALPVGTTFGLTQIKKQLFVFGSTATPGTIPAGVNYQRLAHTASANMTGIIDVTSYGGKIYAIASFDNGDIFHYYDGARVISWDAVAGAITSNASIASALAAKLDLDPRYIASSNAAVLTLEAGVAGVGFTITESVVQAGVNDQAITLATLQANVPAVAETPAHFTMTIQGGTPSNDPMNPNQNALYTLHDTNGLDLIVDPLPWAASNNLTAQLIAAAINAQTAALSLINEVGYTASAAINVVTIHAPAGAGTGNNGLHIFSRTTGNFDWDSATVTGITNTGTGEVDCGAQSGGVNAIAPIAQVVTATISGTTAGVKATGQITFTANPANNDSIVLNGTQWNFVTGTPTTDQTKIGASLAATLAQLVIDLTASSDINIQAGTYTATGTVLNITAANAGAGGNTYTLVSNQVNAVVSGATMTGGGFPNSAQYTLTVDGTAYKITGLAAGYGITCLTYNQRIYCVTNSLLEYCALNAPTNWDYTISGSTAGFINMTNQDADNDTLVGIQQYQNRIAIFSRANIQIWILAVDASQNTFQQSVQNTGALSNRSICQYGNIDVFYLDTSGERSIRARDASNAPAVNDVGVAIDPFIQAYTDTLSGKQIDRACSVIEPIDGRYWLAMHNRIFVYSFFPGSKISAWTYYDCTDEIGSTDISEMVRAGNRVYVRAGDNIYLYGGDTNQVYPNKNEILTTVSLPYLSASKPATVKGINGFDLGISGVWDAYLLPVPSDDTVELSIGVFDAPTYSLTDNPIQMPTPLFAIRMSCSAAGPATLSNMVVHFDYDD